MANDQKGQRSRSFSQNRGFKSGTAKGAAGERVDRPASLGNVTLRVEGFEKIDGVTAVKGTNLRNDKPVTVFMLTPALAAKMFTKDSEVEQERIAIWQKKLENQPSLEKYADASGDHHVKPGGLLELSNVRLNYEDKQYYAQSSFGLVRDPSTGAALSGVIALDKFDKGGVRMQVFQPENAVALKTGSPEDVATNRAAISAAFSPKAPVGDGQMARVAMVTVSQENENGYITFNSYYAKSAQWVEKANEGAANEESTYHLSKDFGETLTRQDLDLKSGIAYAVLGAVAQLPFEKIAARVAEGEKREETVTRLRDYYDSVANGEVQVSIMPGYTVPLLKNLGERLENNKAALATKVFRGTVAVATAIPSTGEVFSRPSASAFSSHMPLSTKPRENAYSLDSAASSAHRKLFDITFGSKDQDAEQEQEQKQDAALSQGPASGIDF